MNSLFDKNGNREIINRINNLSTNSNALWGKMTVDQMLSHCIAPLDVAFGNHPIKANFIMQFVGKIMKNKILSTPEFKKNSPTAPSFIRKEQYDFYTTKEELIHKVERFATEGTLVIKNKRHPFFGEMSYQEWDNLQWKHLDHHLKQFGV